MNLVREFTKGLYRENAVFKLLLGMCPTLAVTTSAENGIGMGLATTFVLVCSNAVVSLMRNLIPGKVRIPAFIVIIASFVTVVQLIMEAYVYNLHKALGIFIPLIVVNCVILGRAEAFASKNPVRASLVDGFGMGLGFTLALFPRRGPRTVRLRRPAGLLPVRRDLPAVPAADPPPRRLHRPRPPAGRHEPLRPKPKVTGLKRGFPPRKCHISQSPSKMVYTMANRGRVADPDHPGRNVQ